MASGQISIRAGDLCELWFCLRGADREAIENVCFRSDDLGFYSYLPYSESEGGYCLRLSSRQTEDLPPSVCRYDLTAELTGGNTVTLIENGIITVTGKPGRQKRRGKTPRGS